ncbi:hypothetical protein BGP77_12455 [Saccharospirillum sp. MSK14-1]|uniref:hypothetical protein n=1 Tax=Saccharospirillum sp. MSK14-1 TaxID=1897632 RepID=UPI000D3BF822|nr:hypothetical protein [Saccharospirillum sp. MSK14-1]PTY38511.1 hypothetical protein BGP77_12455 [Saccharospirillum sp. MSK14-1]
MFKPTLITVVILLLAGCSAVPIQEVDPADLDIKVEYRHQPDTVDLRTQLRAGMWSRRVNADSNGLEVITAGGEVVRLKPGIEEGDYGAQLEPDFGPYQLILPSVAQMTLPLTEPVTLNGQAQIAGQVFDRSDELSLAVAGQTERVRGWSFTAYCGAEYWTLDLSLAQDETEIQLPLATLMRQINARAEADLAGQIPVKVTLWESYQPSWVEPFRPGVARAEDSVDFTVDTASFRVSGNFRLALSDNLSIGVSNQAWPVRYCH